MCVNHDLPTFDEWKAAGQPDGRALFHTYTGRSLDLLAMTVSDIDIYDIAHHLACVNRFTGATREPISVAQHSVCVSRLCAIAGPDAALQGLLHDGSEAYLADVTKWLKQSPCFAEYRVLEARVQGIIYEKFGCPPADLPEICAADKLMVRLEMTSGFGMDWPGILGYPPATDDEWDRLYRVLGAQWYPWPWALAKERFLTEFRRLTEKPWS